MTLFTPFLESPSMLKCSKFISILGLNNSSNVGARSWSPNPKRNRGVQSLDKMQERIIKVTTQFLDGSPIEPKGVNAKSCNDYSVLAREKCKITWIDWGVVPVNEKETLWELIKPHYVVPSEHEERGKRTTTLTIGRALRRFRYALNK
jgi:hypothetical protein